MDLLVQEQDVPKYAQMMRDQWLELVAKEGTVGAMRAAPHADGGDGDPDGELPCPACGTAAPLVDGCCSDCGLNLE